MKKRVAEWKEAYVRPADIPHPDDNEYTDERELLGRTLFFDPRLSGSSWISCATCHNPALSFGDGLPQAIGHGMKVLERRTPTVLNLAWAPALMWDGREMTLESQALGPVAAAGEMNLPVAELEQRLNDVAGYDPLFEAAYPGEPIAGDTIGKAIAVFERTVVSGKAPFDAWIEGDESAISEDAKHGFVVFHQADCHQCHSGWRFTDDGFYDIGLNGEDLGRGGVLPIPTLEHAFKTPTLREATRRGPFMHDGSLADLREVVDYYDRGGEAARAQQSAHVKPRNLSEHDKESLVAFLETLTGPSMTVQVPELPL